MRSIVVILIALAGVGIVTGSSYMNSTGTQAIYVFQDTLSPAMPWPAGYKGIEDAMLTGGTAATGPKRNWGLSELFRLGVSSAVNGLHRGIMRHNPFYVLDSTNVASWDSVVITFTSDTTPVLSPHADTLYCFGLDETRWVEGAGIGNAADTFAVNATCYNLVTTSADSTWKAFRAGKSDSTRFTGIATVRADSFPGLVNYDAIFYGGKIVQGTTDRMPYPAAVRLSNDLLTPSGTAWTWNITNAVLWQLKRNQPINMLFSMRCDTTGVKATQAGATQDSVSGQKLDIRSSDYVSIPASRPILTYYVRLKRRPIPMGVQ